MGSKKKVLQVIQPVDGGSALHVRQLLSRMNKDDYELHLAAPEHVDYKEVCEDNKIQHHITPFSRSFNPLSSVGPFLNLAKLLRSEKFEVVHLHSTTAGLLGRFAAIGTNAKVIYTPHSPLYFQLSGFKKKIFYWVERATGFLVDEFVLVSPSEKNRVVVEGMAPAQKCTVIVNGVELPKLMRKQNGRPVITMVSRLEKQKRQQDLIQAAPRVLKEFPEVEFRLIGEGSRLHELKELISELKLEQSVKLMGARNDIAKQWSESTIAVQCSEAEGLPYAVLEAMSAGLPVVGTRVEGIVDLISEGKNGMLYDKGVVQQLAEHLIHLLKNSNKAQEYGMLGRRIVEAKYSLHSMISSLEELYAKQQTTRTTT